MANPTYQYNADTDTLLRIFSQVNPQTGKVQVQPNAQVITRDTAAANLSDAQLIVSLFPVQEVAQAAASTPAS